MKKRIKGIKLALYSTIILVVFASFPVIGTAVSPAKAEPKQIFVREVHTPLPYKQPIIAQNEKAKATYIIKSTWRKDWKVGLALARCESGFREKVVNSIHATGYFQVLAPVHNIPVEAMQDGWANASYAYILYQEQGLNPWKSSESCWEGLI